MNDINLIPVGFIEEYIDYYIKSKDEFKRTHKDLWHLTTEQLRQMDALRNAGVTALTDMLTKWKNDCMEDDADTSDLSDFNAYVEAFAQAMKQED